MFFAGGPLSGPIPMLASPLPPASVQNPLPVWHNHGDMPRQSSRRDRRAVSPLDPAGLESLALRYVERFATTRARLTDYLTRKVRERGWEGDPADPAAIAQRMADLGYIDDRLWGEAKAAAMARRGLGARRVAGALRQAGVVGDDADAIEPAIGERSIASAIAFARRRRIGPFAAEAPDRILREKQVAALLRAGHSPDIARRILAMAPGDDPETLLD